MHTQSGRRIWAGLGTVLLVLAGLGGCTDLSAVREFAKLSSATTEYPALVDDYAALAPEMANYALSSMERDLQLMDLEATLAEAEILKDRQIVVAAYMEALGNLADDHLTQFEAETTTVFDRASKTGLVDPGESDAYAQIATKLLELVAGTYRQQQLQQIIEQTDPAFQDAVGMLRATVADFVTNRAENRKTMALYYDHFDPEGTADGFSKPSGPGIAALRAQRRSNLRSFDHRTEAAKAYLEVLDQMAAGHASLASSKSLTDKETIEGIKLYSSQLRSLYASIKDF